nr:VOC family protein [uncultured Brevundimonas sp.]
MPQLLFINLPVTDLNRSIAFYEAVGAVRNPNFSDDTAACMVISDVIHVMILTHDKWRTFTDRQIPDAQASAQMLLCLSHDSREAVDAIVAKAEQAGGTADPNAPQDHGFMYGRSYADPDGHIWEVMWMDTAGIAAETHSAPETSDH